MYDVYIVDDDEMILREIAESIPWLDNGFTVVGSNRNPETALEEILELRPAAVFSDLKMPKLGGLELLSALTEAGFDGEYIIISAYDAHEDTRALFLRGGFDYILKPINRNDVQIVLERLSKKLQQKEPPILRAPAATPVALLELLENPTSSQSLNELTAYLAQNIHLKFSLDGLGKQFGLSPNYICNLFTKHYGITFTQFLTILRMKEAARLISTTDCSLKEIAIDCGYPDYYYFFKVFKEYYGASPTSYRKLP